VLSSSAPLIGSSHGQDVVFGLIVVLVMILLPNGFAGLLRAIDSRVNSAIKSDTTTS
jgi:ABC-type branched-subunit amino acid transport system permease subunit